MALPNALEEREYSKFKDVANQATVAVCNPDGSYLGAPTTGATAYTVFKNAGANATLNVKATAGRVYSISCFNANAAIRYLQLHNKATAATAAEVPQFSIEVFPNTTTVIGTDFFGLNGEAFTTGISFAFSTTAWTYTAGTASDQSIQIRYI